MSGWRARDAGVLAGWVEGVARAHGAETVLADDDLGGGAAAARIRVIAPGAAAWTEASADVVVSVVDPAREPGWAEHVRDLAKRARVALLVVARNAERPGQGGAPGTTELAGVLWSIGRVREHAFLGVPRILGGAPVVLAPAGALVRRTARLHAFVVDTAPRTRQARRRLRLAAGA